MATLSRAPPALCSVLLALLALSFPLSAADAVSTDRHNRLAPAVSSFQAPLAPVMDVLTASPDPSSAISPPIPSNYVGFSLESFFLRSFMGSEDDDRPRPSFVELIRQLQLTKNQPGMTFRMGGWSVDETYYQPGDLLDPPLSSYPGPAWRYNLTSADLAMLRNAMEATNGSLILGLNIRGDPAVASLAVNFTRAVERIVGWRRVAALEVGNEQNGYGGSGIRPKNYSYTDYRRDFDAVYKALHAAVPSLPSRLFQAGAFSDSTWDAQLPSFVTAYSSGTFYQASLHHYPTTHCGGNVVTVEQVLSNAYASMEADWVRKSGLVDALQRADGVGLIVGEGNTASCFGAPHVSNSFASALWTIDALFSTAAVGMKGWSFTVGGVWGGATRFDIPVTDAAFQFTSFAGDAALVVEPMYYGLRVFAMATADAAVLVDAAAHSSNPLVKLWTTASFTTLSVVALHKDTQAADVANVTVCPKGGAEGEARLTRLNAPRGNASAEFGITLAGQTYDGSVDGRPVGGGEEVRLRAVRGCYQFFLDPVSAALLSIPRRAQWSRDS